MSDDSPTTADQVVGDDVAEAEFNRFMAALRAKANTDRMSDERRADFESNKGKVMDALRDGSLRVDDKGQPYYTPEGPFPSGPLRFKKPTGATLMSANGLGEDAGIAQTFKMLSQLTGQTSVHLEQLDLCDLTVPLALVAILLG